MKAVAVVGASRSVLQIDLADPLCSKLAMRRPTAECMLEADSMQVLSTALTACNRARVSTRCHGGLVGTKPAAMRAPNRAPKARFVS